MSDRYAVARDFLLTHFSPEELPEVMARILEGAGHGDAREMVNGPRLHAALVIICGAYSPIRSSASRPEVLSCDAALKAVGWQGFFSTRGLDDETVARLHAIARGETKP